MEYYRFNNPQRRKKDHNYAQNGHYFVTICTKNRYPWFGKIQNNCVELSDSGLIVKNQWEWLEKHYEYVHLDEFIVMPDHFHGIIAIDAKKSVDAHCNAHLQSPLNTQIIVKPIPNLIAAFKSTSFRQIRDSGNPDFRWQRSFHDRIIRNPHELEKIREYIVNNPIASRSNKS